METMNIETEKYLAQQIECADDYSKAYKLQWEYFDRIKESAESESDSFPSITGIRMAKLEMTISELTKKLVDINKLINPVQDKTQEHIKF